MSIYQHAIKTEDQAFAGASEEFGDARVEEEGLPDDVQHQLAFDDAFLDRVLFLIGGQGG
jgi:hypothetical protein